LSTSRLDCQSDSIDLNEGHHVVLRSSTCAFCLSLGLPIIYLLGHYEEYSDWACQPWHGYSSSFAIETFVAITRQRLSKWLVFITNFSGYRVAKTDQSPNPSFILVMGGLKRFATRRQMLPCALLGVTAFNCKRHNYSLSNAMMMGHQKYVSSWYDVHQGPITLGHRLGIGHISSICHDPNHY